MKLTRLLPLATIWIMMGISAVRAELEPVPIRELLEKPTGVAIAGEVESIVGNEFILDDGTGQIIVDAGPRWWHQIELLPGETVTVVGEYDDYDFDAFSITREDGTIIEIRDASGPPPWAGGPNRRRRN